MLIIMLGAPGSGKGTVGRILSKELDLSYISTGDIFREHKEKKTELGLKIQESMNKGLLISDELTNEILEQALNDVGMDNNILLDGYPRTLEQCKKLDEILSRNGKKITSAIYLSVEDEEIIERITSRRVCSNNECKEIYNLKSNPPEEVDICDKCGSKLIQRSDDTEEIIRDRLNTYYENVQEIVDFYKRKDVLKKVNNSEEVSLNNVVSSIIKDLKRGVK